jgi:hypothetical protein
MQGPECAICPVGDNVALCQLASRIEDVFYTEALDALGRSDLKDAAEIEQREITSDDVARLNPELEEDIELSLTGCFASQRDRARQNSETLASLVDEQRIAVAGCATHQLRGTCER